MAWKDDNSYKNILKGISFFGSVHVLQILINVVRGKFVALLLGSAGMGVSALFASSSLTLQRFSSLGLNLAIVKETAAASEDHGKLMATMAVAKKMLTATSLLATLICILFSKWLSIITFGDNSMQLEFMLLGIAVGLTVAFNGKLSILQGLHEVKAISRASIVGGLTGLFVGVPLYYFYGINGIVPAMIILALSLFLFYSRILDRHKNNDSSIKFNWKEHKPIVIKLLTLGILLMSNDLLLSLTQYLINIFVNSRGSTDTVGFYQAANSITAQYSGIVFTVMAMDYFPRLSKAASDNSAMREVVNRQLAVTGLIVAPASALLIMTAPFLIRLLLSSEFLPVTDLMRWMGLGITFRALMTPLGYISFAKGNKKLFFWMEGVGCNLLTLILSCSFFNLFGLIGLGYALVADNAICLVIYYIVNRHLYSFRFTPRALAIGAMTIALTSLAFASSMLPETVAYISMGATTLVSGIITIICLRRLLKP